MKISGINVAYSRPVALRKNTAQKTTTAVSAEQVSFQGNKVKTAMSILGGFVGGIVGLCIAGPAGAAVGAAAGGTIGYASESEDSKPSVGDANYLDKRD